MFQTESRTSLAHGAATILVLVFHNTVRSIRKTHRDATVAILYNILQTVIMVGAFFVLLDVLGFVGTRSGGFPAVCDVRHLCLYDARQIGWRCYGLGRANVADDAAPADEPGYCGLRLGPRRVLYSDRLNDRDFGGVSPCLDPDRDSATFWRLHDAGAGVVFGVRGWHGLAGA